MTIKEKITRGSINIDGEELDFNEFVEHEAKAIKKKYNGIEDRIRKKVILIDILFDPFKRVLGIIFIITLNISIFTFFMLLDTPDWGKVIMTYLLLSNIIPYLMHRKETDNETNNP